MVLKEQNDCTACPCKDYKSLSRMLQIMYFLSFGLSRLILQTIKDKQKLKYCSVFMLTLSALSFLFDDTTLSNNRGVNTGYYFSPVTLHLPISLSRLRYLDIVEAQSKLL